MATVAPTHRAGSPPERFVEALNGLVVGIVSLEFVRRTLAAALEADERAAPAVQSLMDDAYHEGRLASRDYEALSIDLGSHIGEDAPTEWSEQARYGAVSATGSDSPGAEAAPTGTPSLHPGTILRDRFVLQARLGSSGMSDVFKALDRRRQEAGADNPWVAIKVIGPATPRFPDALKLLQHEAALAQRLDHPHIVRVYDFDRDGEYAFITMEWLDGESLGDVLTRQRLRSLSLANARQILDEIGEALAFAHARGITHADIKPGNIFLMRDGPARLLDFGIARSSTAATGAVARTPAYASCEVLEGYAAEPCDDVYSLACVCYRMLAGRRPFGHNDALAAERAGRRPAPIRTLGPSQWTALERALELRRANRTPDIETFLAEFDSSPLRAPSAAAGRPVAAAPRRATPAMAAGVATLVAVLIAAVAWLNTDTTTDDGAATVTTAPQVAAPAPVTSTTPVPPVAMTAATDETAKAQPVAPKEPDAAGAGSAKPAREKTAATGKARAAPPVAKRSAAKPAKAAVAGTAAALPAIAPESPTVGDLAKTATGDAAPGGLADTTPGSTLVPLKQFRFRRFIEPVVDSGRDRAPNGWVEVEFLVDAKGVTRDVAVVSSSPAGRYEAAALAAVKRWRFVPAKEDGKPVERRTSVRLRFQPE